LAASSILQLQSLRPNTQVVCPYCGSRARLTDSAIVYHGRSYGPIYLCSKWPECDAYVGADKKSGTPLGRLANKELREWKKKAHQWIDPLWRSGILSRAKVYRIISGRMRIDPSKAHVGMFNIDQCKKAISVIRRYCRDYGIMTEQIEYPEKPPV
jgi:hypothetical protein